MSLEPDEDCWWHVAPARARHSILTEGLIPNAGGGNYSGWEQALPGVYLTRDPDILLHHISNRDYDDFLLVSVKVDGPTFIDEDELMRELNACFRAACRANGVKHEDPEQVDDCFAAVADDTFSKFQVVMGRPDQGRVDAASGLNQDADDMLREYVETWIREHVLGEPCDGCDWWAQVKRALVEGYPDMNLGREALSIRVPDQIHSTGGLTYIHKVMLVQDGRLLHLPLLDADQMTFDFSTGLTAAEVPDMDTLRIITTPQPVPAMT